MKKKPNAEIIKANTLGHLNYETFVYELKKNDIQLVLKTID